MCVEFNGWWKRVGRLVTVLYLMIKSIKNQTWRHLQTLPFNASTFAYLYSLRFKINACRWRHTLPCRQMTINALRLPISVCPQTSPREAVVLWSACRCGESVNLGPTPTKSKSSSRGERWPTCCPDLRPKFQRFHSSGAQGRHGPGRGHITRQPP